MKPRALSVKPRARLDERERRAARVRLLPRDVERAPVRCRARRRRRRPPLLLELVPLPLELHPLTLPFPRRRLRRRSPRPQTHHVFVRVWLTGRVLVVHLGAQGAVVGRRRLGDVPAAYTRLSNHHGRRRRGRSGPRGPGRGRPSRPIGRGRLLLARELGLLRAQRCRLRLEHLGIEQRWGLPRRGPERAAGSRPSPGLPRGGTGRRGRRDAVGSAPRRSLGRSAPIAP